MAIGNASKTWDDERVPTRRGARVEVVLVVDEGETLRPYDGVSWPSGRLQLRPNQASKLRTLAEEDPRSAAARKACGYARIVPLDRHPDGSLSVVGCVVTQEFGLEFSD